MLVKFECYDCILKQVVKMSREIGKSEDDRKRIVREMLKHVVSEAERKNPPEMARFFYDIFTRETQVADPYRDIKIASTRIGLELLDELRPLVSKSADPLKTAIKLAIGGNIIDYGVNPDFRLAEAKNQVRQVIDAPHDEAALTDLTDRIRRAEQVCYLLDNCGEAVLDRLVLEQIPGRVIVAVRGKPILNDVTRQEAVESGLGNYQLVDTGCAAPGVVLSEMPPDLQQAMTFSDLIVSKGQGNYESLEGNFTSRPIYYLLRVKCPVISRQLNAPLGSIQVIGGNLD